MSTSPGRTYTYFADVNLWKFPLSHQIAVLIYLTLGDTCTCTVKLSFLLKVFIWFQRREVVNMGNCIPRLERVWKRPHMLVCMVCVCGSECVCVCGSGYVCVWGGGVWGECVCVGRGVSVWGRWVCWGRREVHCMWVVLVCTVFTPLHPPSLHLHTSLPHTCFYTHRLSPPLPPSPLPLLSLFSLFSPHHTKG